MHGIASTTGSGEVNKCGYYIERNMTLTNNCSGAYCYREYYLYLPTKICRTEANAAETYPVLFAVHCLNCLPQSMMFWHEYAEQYNFVLVLPAGISKSFNAKYCCGKARDK